ncbi:hypothetical protein [Halostella salina]|uniref:hypothetical protein n=1 Tax=Halostella salina TaxID=1547897 RepID=UPI000EF77E9F|nr:hypothetical protein [Halostella salina]
MESIPLLALRSVGPLIAIVFIAVGAGVLAVFARRSAARLLTMIRTDTRPINAIDPGQVKIEGTVVSAGKAAENAGSGFYTGAEDPVITESRRTDGDDRNFTLPVPQQFAPDLLNEQNCVPFYVEDETGRVLVDPALADVSLDSDYSRSDTLSGNKRIEAALEPEETVTVLGQAVLSEEYDRRATRRGGLLRSVYRFFRPPLNTTADQVIDDNDQLVITRTMESSPFLIADASPRRGVLRQGLMVAFWIITGLSSIVFGLYTLLSALL